MNQLVEKTLEVWFSINEKIRYILVGGYNTVLSYLIFCFLNYVFAQHLHYLAILAISTFISVINSFFCFRFFVFRSQKNLWQEYLKVNIVYLGYLACNSLLLFIMKDLLNIDVLVAQLICIAIITTAVYFIHKNFSFKK